MDNVADERTPESALEAKSIHNSVESPNNSDDRLYPSKPNSRIGLRPTRSETLPHIGPKSSSRNADVEMSKPRWLPLAPIFSM